MGLPFDTTVQLLRTPGILAVTDKHHGLGNRIRAVLGSRALARFEGRTFAYTWPTGSQFGAGLDQLWDVDEPIVSTAASRLIAPWYPYQDNTLRWLDAQAREKRLWQIRTPHALVLPNNCPSWETELRALSPAPSVRQRIMETFNAGPAGRPFVGVMIRTNTNAHRETLTHSPLQWYFARMREIRAVWPDVHFYVSADTTAAFAETQRKFANCHGMLDKGPYNSKRALAASVVDLYMLASSSHLLAPHFSSFPELSQRLAGPELRLETSRSGPETVFAGLDQLTTAPCPLDPSNRRRLQ